MRSASQSRSVTGAGPAAVSSVAVTRAVSQADRHIDWLTVHEERRAFVRVESEIAAGSTTRTGACSNAMPRPGYRCGCGPDCRRIAGGEAVEEVAAPTLDLSLEQVLIRSDRLLDP